MNTLHDLESIWTQLGLPHALRQAAEPSLPARSPIDGQTLGQVAAISAAEVPDLMARSQDAFRRWRDVPAPRRGELVRLFGQVLREHKAELGRLVSLEVGKITSEGQGEVQEMIDIADFAVGLSRQLHGLTIASERSEHRMMEQWHPLGPVAVITAFNFPVAVWAWNAALAVVCGNPVVWKPSEKAPLCALAVQGLWARACERFGQPDLTRDLSLLALGRGDVGAALAADPRAALVSATGSTRMGRAVAPVVAARFGRCLLELGGNNGLIVTPSADLDLATRAIVFGAVGTAGQRCTTTRRLIVHRSVRQALVERVVRAYASVRIGDPRVEGVLMGPLIDEAAAQAMMQALQQAQAEGGERLFGGLRLAPASMPSGLAPVPAGGTYVQPALMAMPAQSGVVRHETFAPILYLLEYEDFEQALQMHNEVPQGLSSAIFTRDLIEAETFLSARGSDCGIANVNLGTSGAEIGGAFGGDKDTGGGRESGSDAWRQYMRRTTNTVNRGRLLPLAQGVSFEV